MSDESDTLKYSREQYVHSTESSLSSGVRFTGTRTLSDLDRTAHDTSENYETLTVWCGVGLDSVDHQRSLGVTTNHRFDEFAEEVEPEYGAQSWILQLVSDSERVSRSCP